MKKFLTFISLSILLLAACGTDNADTSDSSDKGDEQNVTSIFVTDASNLGSTDKTFEKQEDIEAFLTAFERGEFHEGPTTAEAPNYRVTLTHDGGSTEEYLLWVRHGSPGGRYQTVPASLTGVYILTDEDAAKLGNLLAER
ncbi:hypothetical protein [Planomicrobium sp. YIM 101495]|uniref:hypothetical protein n=1 Tax=Planomicrobium sp. YIM 101495 TaxID=2665160 RepID=UPI0012B93599|nr:hypothetical protein [Planomicrobium sp. YIM 101495]MTD31331.1 hypothetical protein [Planomicrobium sp. YIM 101495]